MLPLDPKGALTRERDIAHDEGNVTRRIPPNYSSMLESGVLKAIQFIFRFPVVSIQSATLLPGGSFVSVVLDSTYFFERRW